MTIAGTRERLGGLPSVVPPCSKRRTHLLKKLVPGLVIGALVLGSSAVAAQDGGTLAAVQERGTLVCGVNGGLPGMSVLNEETGIFEGMDADYCRALAAAVLGDPDAVQYTPLTADQRATAIQGGEVDVIFRNTTNTLTRDASWGDFGPTIFYDGQGMMVPTELGVTSLEELAGASICVTSGTTTEQNLADQMAFLGVDYTPGRGGRDRYGLRPVRGRPL